MACNYQQSDDKLVLKCQVVLRGLLGSERELETAKWQQEDAGEDAPRGSKIITRSIATAKLYDRFQKEVSRPLQTYKETIFTIGSRQQIANINSTLHKIWDAYPTALLKLISEYAAYGKEEFAYRSFRVFP